MNEGDCHEIFGTISQAVDANYQALVGGNYHSINAFIDRITQTPRKPGETKTVFID